MKHTIHDNKLDPWAQRQGAMAVASFRVITVFRMTALILTLLATSNFTLYVGLYLKMVALEYEFCESGSHCELVFLHTKITRQLTDSPSVALFTVVLRSPSR